MKRNSIVVFIVAALLAFVSFKVIWAFIVAPLYKPLTEVKVEGFQMYKNIIVGGELWIGLAFSLIVGAGAAVGSMLRKK